MFAVVYIDIERMMIRRSLFTTRRAADLCAKITRGCQVYLGMEEC